MRALWGGEGGGAVPTCSLGARRLAKIKAWVDEHERESIIIPYCADLERELSELDEDGKKAKLEELGVSR